MNKIVKYQVPMNQEFSLDIPQDSQILNVQILDSNPVLWVLIDDSKYQVTTNFLLYTSESPIPSTDNLSYIGSFSFNSFEGHLFRKK